MKRTPVIALLALAACGPMSQGSMGKTVTDVAKSRVGALLGRPPASASAAPAIPDIANAAPGELLMVSLESRQAVAVMTRIASNNGTDTFLSPNNVSMTFRDGILTSSRGLNEDLMGADTNGVQEALAAGGGTYMRTHSFLDSEDQISARKMTCVMTAEGMETITTINGVQETQKLSETCTGPALIFTNTYWLDDGAILQSLQALAPRVGYIKVNPL